MRLRIAFPSIITSSGSASSKASSDGRSTTRYPGCETLKDELHPVNYLERNVFVGEGVLLQGSGWNQQRRNWRFAACPDLDELARETCFDPLPPESEIGTY